MGLEMENVKTVSDKLLTYTQYYATFKNITSGVVTFDLFGEFLT